MTALREAERVQDIVLPVRDLSENLYVFTKGLRFEEGKPAFGEKALQVREEFLAEPLHLFLLTV